jgi:hypothetical protein
MSGEHYLPAGLGSFRGVEPLQDRVCRDCNNQLGRLDEVFLRTGFAGFFRHVADIAGRDKERPSPFQRGAAGVPPIEMRGAAPGTQYEILWELIPGTNNAQPLRQVVFEDPDGRTHRVQITDRMKEEPGLLQAEIRTRGLEAAKLSVSWAPVEDIPWMNELLASLIGAPPGPWEAPDFRVDGITLPATVTIKEEYFRAIAKIGFHYVLKVFPDLTGQEAQFDLVRNYIWQGSGGGPKRPVRQLTRQIVGELQRGHRPRYWAHILGASRTSTLIVAHAQFFVGPRSLPLPFEIFIGANPAVLYMPPERRGHLFIMDPAARETGHAGVMESLFTTTYIIPVALTFTGA